MPVENAETSGLFLCCRLFERNEVLRLSSEYQRKQRRYTGETASLESFMPLLKRGLFLYAEVIFHKSNAHLYLIIDA